MKTFQELWFEVERQNPKIESGKVSMSTDNFKKALRLAYETGRESNYLFNNLFGGMP